MTDVWVVYRDHGAYSDWGRDLIGVYGSLPAAQAGALAFHAQWPSRAIFGGWADDEDRAVDGTTLATWEAVEGDRGDDADVVPQPVERWVARPVGQSLSDLDGIEFYVERWVVADA